MVYVAIARWVIGIDPRSWNLTQVACPPQQWEGLAATLAAFEASL
jgi:hypothetical protein